MTKTVQKELAQAREVCPTTTKRLLKDGALLLDVREPAEVEALGFADCDLMTIPLSQFEGRWAEVPRDRDVIVACAGGTRSLKATYFLMYQGYDRVTNMQYGMNRWAAKGFPVTGDAATASMAAPVSACGCGDGAAAVTEPAGCGCEGKAPANEAAKLSGGACC